MHTLTARNYAILTLLIICIALATPAKIAHAQSGSGQPAPNDTSFVSKKEAEEFLARTLPVATAGNPKYRSRDTGVATRWLTKTISFRPGESGALLVSMSEQIIEFKKDAPGSTGSHEAEFSIEDVRISEHKGSGDVTENGDAALGIIFNCISGKCIKAKWNDNPSLSDWTDIYIQDATLRAGILKAFQALKRAP